MFAGAVDEVDMPSVKGLTVGVTPSAYSLMLQVVEPPHLAADYNGKGVVDAAHYTEWHDSIGSGTSLTYDDTSGVGADDYIRWKATVVDPPAMLWLTARM